MASLGARGVPLAQGYSGPIAAEAIRGLQRSAGNRAVARLLATAPGGTGLVQRAWRAQSVRLKTTMRADVSGAPAPRTKLGRTILAGTAVEVGKPPVNVGIWTQVQHQGVLGWIRTRKLTNPTSPAQRIGEGVLLLVRSGHVPGGVQLSAAIFAEKMTALPPVSFLNLYRHHSGKPQATAGDAGLGFTLQTTKRMFVLDTALGEGTVLHEMLHFLENGNLSAQAGRPTSEGATEYCRRVLQPTGGPAVHANYQRFHDAFWMLAVRGGDTAQAAIMKAYFEGDLGAFETQINTHIKRKTLAKYKDRIARELGFSSVKALLGNDPWAHTAYEIWCALGNANFGDMLYPFLAGVDAYEAADEVQPPVATPTAPTTTGTSPVTGATSP
jgi:hypothetical protein